MLLPLLATLAALAPTLQTAHPCYLQRQPVRLTGAGFTPGAPYNVTLDRAPVGSGVVGADGKLGGTLSSGTLTGAQRQQHHVIAVDDGRASGNAAFDVSAFGAGFKPSTGDPRTLRVRFAVTGIGVADPTPARVWLHYIDPRGHLLRTVSLGLTGEPCGSLASSAPLRLFPFHKIGAGRWTLQFDLSRRYSPAAQPRIGRLVAVK